MGRKLFTAVLGFFRKRVPFLDLGFTFVSDVVFVIDLARALVFWTAVEVVDTLRAKFPLLDRILNILSGLAKALWVVFKTIVVAPVKLVWAFVKLVLWLCRFIAWTTPKMVVTIVFRIVFWILKQVGYWSLVIGIVLPLTLCVLVVTGILFVASGVILLVTKKIDQLRHRFPLFDRALDVLDWFFKLPWRTFVIVFKVVRWIVVVALKVVRWFLVVALTIAVTCLVGPVALVVAFAFGAVGLKIDAIGVFIRFLRRKFPLFDKTLNLASRCVRRVRSLASGLISSIAGLPGFLVGFLGFLWRKRFAIIGLAMFVGAGLGAFEFYIDMRNDYQPQGDYAVREHAHTSFGLFADGVYFDVETAYNMPDRDTQEAFFTSLRPLVFLYVDARGNQVITRPAIGIVISDKYVVTCRQLLNPQQGLTFVAAALAPLAFDRNQTLELLEGYRVENAAPFFAVFERPAVPVLDAKPLTLGDGPALKAGDELVGVLADGSTVTRTVQDRHRPNNTETIAFYLERVGCGTPLFQLNEGVPEFVGMAAEQADRPFSTFGIDTRGLQRLGYIYDLENLLPQETGE